MKNNANTVGTARPASTLQGGAADTNYGFGGSDWDTELQGGLFGSMSSDVDAGAWNGAFKKFVEEAAPMLTSLLDDIQSVPVNTDNQVPTIALIAKYTKGGEKATFVLPVGVVGEHFHQAEKQIQIVLNQSMGQQIAKNLPQPASTLLNSAFSNNTLEAVKAQVSGKAQVAMGLLTPSVDPTRDTEAAKKFVQNAVAELCRLVTEDRSNGASIPVILKQNFQVNEMFAASNPSMGFQKASSELVLGQPVRSDATVRIANKNVATGRTFPMARVSSFVELLSGPKRGGARGSAFSGLTNVNNNNSGICPGILRSIVRITNFGLPDYSVSRAWYAIAMINMLRIAMDSSGAYLFRALAPSKDAQIGNYNRRNLGAFDHEVVPGAPVTDGGRFFVRDTVSAENAREFDNYLFTILNPGALTATEVKMPVSMVSFDWQPGTVEGNALRIFRVAAMSNEYISHQPSNLQETFRASRAAANKEVTRIFDSLTAGQFSIAMENLGKKDGQVFTDNNRMIAFGTYTNEANEIRDIRELDTVAFANYLVSDRTQEYPIDAMIAYEATISHREVDAEARLAMQLDYWKNAGRNLNVTGLGWNLSFTMDAYHALYQVMIANSSTLTQERALVGASDGGISNIYRDPEMPTLEGVSYSRVTSTTRNNQSDFGLGMGLL